MSYRSLIEEAARRYGIPLDLAEQLVAAESAGNPGATSPKGAMGLAQLMPGTARDLGVTDPYDPRQNVDAGMRYLAEQYREFGSWPKALAAYNAGPQRVREYGGIPPFPETQAYVNKLMPYAQEASMPMPPQELPPQMPPQAQQQPQEGLFSRLAMNPMFNMGLGILGANTGHYGAAGPAIGGGALSGLQNWQQMQLAQAQQQRLERGPEDPSRWREFERLVASLVRDGMEPRAAAAQARRMVWSGGSGSGEKYTERGGLVYRNVMNPDGTYREVPIGPTEQVAREDRLGSEAAAKAEGGVLGTQRGEGITGYGTAMDNATQSLRVIEDLLQHPGRGAAVGLSSVLPTIPGGKSADYEAKLNQMQGKMFLEAFESLKGGGQITEVEGLKATQAISDLGLAQSEDAHRQSLETLRGIYENAKRRASEKAGRSTTIQPGHVEDGYRFKGGNPADPNAWERAQ